LPSVQPQYFFEWIRTSFEQSLEEFYTILLEKHLQVALDMLEVGICSSLTREVQWRSNVVIMLAKEDAEVHLHSLQTTTEQFQDCRLGKVHRGSEITSGLWDAPDYPTCPRTSL
jgi:hypothetical protein